jgi:hypothetical protein
VFNPQPRVQHIDFGNGRFCLVIDDALREPERLLQWVDAQRAAFRDVDFNAYPGVFLLAPAEVERALNDFFNRHARRYFDARRIVRSHCRFSMVTLPTSALQPRQWFCHRDGAGAQPQQSIQASVLYLFRDAALGGTSFYEARQSAEETALLFQAANTLETQDFLRKYEIPAGYMIGSNAYFERIGGVAAQWNRLIFYDGSLLHSGDIASPERLSDDPLRGRLTLNGFLTSRRRAH